GTSMPKVYKTTHQFDGDLPALVHLSVLEFSDRLLLSVSDSGKLGCFFVPAPGLQADDAEARFGAPKSPATSRAARLLGDSLRRGADAGSSASTAPVVSLCLANESRSRVQLLCELVAQFRTWPQA
ncbi:hypothetical protein BOX15_Mlig006238g1, partial [Macrostomum lignano]